MGNGKIDNKIGAQRIVCILQKHKKKETKKDFQMTKYATFEAIALQYNSIHCISDSSRWSTLFVIRTLESKILLS